MALRRNAAVLGWLVSSITAATGCGGGAEVIDTTPDAPAATGSVKVEPQRGGLALDILVEQLAPPGELSKGAGAYVVWGKPARGGPAQNLGALALEADRGKLRTAAAVEDMSVIVTAEPSAQATAPSGRTVLWAYVDVDEPPAPSQPGDAAAKPDPPPREAPAAAAKALPPKDDADGSGATPPGQPPATAAQCAP